MAQNMLRYCTSRKTVNTVADDLRTFSLYVIARAGFSKSFKSQGKHQEAATTDAKLDYKESLKTILKNCVLIFALGTKSLAKSWLPEKLRTIHKACVAFQKHMTEVYEEEKRSLAQGRAGDRKFMSSLVRASQNEKAVGGGLTESEIYGNRKQTLFSQILSFCA